MTVKNFLEILSIISNVITVSLFIWQIVANRNKPITQKIFSNPYLKVLILSLVITVVIFMLPLLCPYFCPSCSRKIDSVTLVKRDTIVKLDTIRVPIYVHNRSGQKEQHNSQEIDRGSSGIQNNAPNFAPQAGRDMTIVSEPHLQEADKTAILNTMDSLSSQYHVNPDIISLSLTTNSNGGKFASELEDFLRSKGYNNFGHGSVEFSSPLKGYKIQIDTVHKEFWVWIGVF
jgi:hypothetical protein